MKMIRIKSHREMQDFAKDSGWPPPILDYLEAEFHQLAEAIHQDSEPRETFNIGSQGYEFILLETGDPCHALPLHGSHSRVDLSHTSIEYVEKVQLSAKFQVYRIGILPDNEAFSLIYTPVGIHPEETERWLAEQSVEVKGEAK